MAKKTDGVKADRGGAKRPKADFDLLDDETKASLRKKAEERIKEQLREEAEDEFLEQAMRDERRKHSSFANDLQTDEVEVTIDLPEYAASIRINGRDYFNAFPYKVQRHVYNSLVDIMARAWEHQSEIDGRPRHYFQKKRNQFIGRK